VITILIIKQLKKIIIMNSNIYATKWMEAASIRGIIGKSRSIVRGTILSTSSIINKKQEDKYLRLLYCHYVFDDQIKDFELIIKELMKIGEFVNTDTCIEMLKGEKEIDNRYFHLSFDDGFRNNFTNALPIMKKYKVPAIFFVPSSLIEASEEDIKNYCLNTTRYNAVIEMLKWDDLREMISQGYEIGSHTKTHARFSAISSDKLLMEDEIIGSKKELETNLDYECKYISWPYGTLNDADDKSLDMAKTAGYKACFGAFRGSIDPMVTDIFCIPRHHFEAQWPISHIKYFARGNRETA